MGKFLLVVVVFAALVYLTVRLFERRSRRGAPRPAPRRPEPRPMGPDDDPDFLWKLDREKRRKKKDPEPKKDSPSEKDTESGDPDGPSEVA